jgi:hypothetical protein
VNITIAIQVVEKLFCVLKQLFLVLLSLEVEVVVESVE